MKAIRFQSIPVRLAGTILAAGIMFFAVKAFIWCFAASASYNADVKEVADLLVSLSPSDPQTHFTSAVLHEKTFEPVDFDIALREYQTAAALAPNNYLLWLSLGTVFDRAGDTVRAEASLRRAKELAPHYASVNWALGNFLFRQGNDDDEAYRELRQAVSGNPVFAAPAAAAAMQFNDGDLGVVRSRFQGLPSFDVALVTLLVGQKKYDEALEVWNQIEPQAANDKYLEATTALRSSLLSEKRFRDTIKLPGPQIGQGEPPRIEAIANPGFEAPVLAENPNPFDWKVQKSTYPQIAVTDAQKRSGKYSLIALLNGSDFKEFRGVSQVVAVEPGAAYQLKFDYRNDVNSKAEFFWEVVSVKDGKRLSAAGPMQRSLEWTTFSVDFQVPNDTDGVEIRFVRGDCIGQACAGSGSFWFDDFVLTRK